MIDAKDRLLAEGTVQDAIESARRCGMASERLIDRDPRVLRTA